jgi:hypothetical protein
MLALTCGYRGLAQTNDTFRSTFLSETEDYFSDAVVKEDGTLEIQAIDSLYQPIRVDRKRAMLQKALKKWDGEMIFIYSGYTREIWRRNINTGVVSRVDTWNLNNPELAKYQRNVLETTRKHPRFFHIGGQAQFNSDNLNLQLNVRGGFFLLKERWDWALSGSIGVTPSENSSFTSVELGTSSKVYFPVKIKQHQFSPYIGAGVSLVYTVSDYETENDYDYTEDVYGQGTFLIGVSWYVGPGSLDIGTNINMDFRDAVKCNYSLSLGYTFLFR